MRRFPFSPTRSRGSGRAVRRVARSARILTTALVAGVLTTCDQSPVGTDSFATVPCEPPPTPVAGETLEDVSRADLRVAVLDAAERMTASLPADAAGDLRSVLETLAGTIGGTDTDTPCRVLHIAGERLDGLVDDASTQPDREALRLVLDIVSADLANPDR